jgi:uncharacterized protein YeaO (DUF488 family)
LLDRASVAEVKASKISKADGHLVVAMRVYPRFLPRGLTDEYTRSLAPDAALFGRYREIKRQCGLQNQAFQAAGYEQSFALSQEGMNDLARLASLSSRQNVFLICQCDRQEYCHVDLLLLMAECHFGASTGKLPHAYEAFRERLRSERR